MNLKAAAPHSRAGGFIFVRARRVCFLLIGLRQRIAPANASRLFHSWKMAA
jgi:hypothetical protein